MDDTTTLDAQVDDLSATVAEPAAEAADEVDEELLIEEVSIDGMCGVY